MVSRAALNQLATSLTEYAALQRFRFGEIGPHHLEIELRRMEPTMSRQVVNVDVHRCAGHLNQHTRSSITSWRTTPGSLVPQHHVRNFEARLFGVTLRSLFVDLPDQDHRTEIGITCTPCHSVTDPLGSATNPTSIFKNE